MVLGIPNWALRLNLRGMACHANITQHMIFESTKLAAASL